MTEDFESFERIADALPVLTDAMVGVREELVDVNTRLDTVIETQNAAAPALKAIIEERDEKAFEARYAARKRAEESVPVGPVSWWTPARIRAVFAGAAVLLAAVIGAVAANAGPMDNTGALVADEHMIEKVQA